jgi:hypothetical protein
MYAHAIPDTIVALAAAAFVAVMPEAPARCAEQRYRVSFRRDDDPAPWHPYEDDEAVKIVSTMQRHAFGNCKLGDDEAAELVAAGWRRYPIRGYLHGGLALSLDRGGAFSDPWDSGWAGYMLIDPEQITDPDAVASHAVERLNAWINGDLWIVRFYFDGGDHDGEIAESVAGLYRDDAIESAVCYAPEGVTEAEITEAWEHRTHD